MEAQIPLPRAPVGSPPILMLNYIAKRIAETAISNYLPPTLVTK